MKYATFKQSPFGCSQLIAEEELRRNHREAAEAGMSPLVEAFRHCGNSSKRAKATEVSWLAFRERPEKGA